MKVVPRQVEIYIDGKLAKTTDFFFGSAFIENLLPKKYKIEVKKEGFNTWSKSLEIKEKEVTKAWAIILFPEKPKFTVLEKGDENALFSATSTVQINEKDGYSFDKFGNLFKNDEKLSLNPFPVKPGMKYELNVFSEYVFLTEGETLYLFNPDSKSFEKFFEGLKYLRISPDRQKLAYFSNWEIWVMFLNERPDQPAKKAGEKMFLVRLSEEIKNVLWLESDYLVFNTEDKIKIIEIDDRDRINTADIAEFKNPAIFWNKTDKKLYALSEGTVYVSEKLIK